jgi:hypothetical protein
MLSKKGCQQHHQKIVKLPRNLSLYSCVFHYLGIHDAFPLAYFSFNDDLKPDFKVFGNVLIFFTNKFLIKSGLTSTLSSSLHVYYKFRRLVIKNYYREIITGFSLTWADPWNGSNLWYVFWFFSNSNLPSRF